MEILTLSFKKMRLKVSSAKRRPFYLGLNVLKEDITSTETQDGNYLTPIVRQFSTKTMVPGRNFHRPLTSFSFNSGVKVKTCNSTSIIGSQEMWL